jgi:hypothetical protein
MKFSLCTSHHDGDITEGVGCIMYIDFKKKNFQCIDVVSGQTKRSCQRIGPEFRQDWNLLNIMPPHVFSRKKLPYLCSKPDHITGVDDFFFTQLAISR